MQCKVNAAGTDGLVYKLWTQVGLLYDEQSLKNCLDIIRDWSNDDRGFLRKEVPNQGILTPFREGTLQDVAKDVLKLAKDGLARRGLQEGKFLAPLEEVATTGNLFVHFEIWYPIGDCLND